MNIKTKTVLSIVVIAIVGVVLLFNFRNNEAIQPRTSEIPKIPQVNTQKSSLEKRGFSDELVSTTFDILQALSWYHLSSVDTSLDGNDFAAVMTELMNDSRHLRSGNVFVEKYTNHSNEVIKLTAQGMILGSQGVIKANENLLQFLRGLDQQSGSVSEVEYQTATFLSSQKEGYGLIAMSAPQITALMFEPAKSDHPTGAIPYIISKEQRNRLLKEIERLFGDELKKEKTNAQQTGRYNAIMVAVQGIQRNLLSDTYEDARE